MMLLVRGSFWQSLSSLHHVSESSGVWPLKASPWSMYRYRHSGESSGTKANEVLLRTLLRGRWKTRSDVRAGARTDLENSAKGKNVRDRVSSARHDFSCLKVHSHQPSQYVQSSMRAGPLASFFHYCLPGAQPAVSV